MSIELLTWATYGLLLGAIVYFLLRNDEFPLLLAAFLYLTGLQRYEAVQSGQVKWVRVAYASGVDFFTMNDELAIRALNLFVLGTAVLMIAYISFRLPHKSRRRIDNPGIFKQFFLKRRTTIIAIFVFFLFFNSISRNFVRGGIAYGNSYFLLFGMAVGGIILLMYLVFKNMTLKRQGLSKLIFAGLIVIAAGLSYSASGRFKFLSWAVALGLIITRDMHPFKKAQIYAIGGVIILSVFALAGVSRYQKLDTLTTEEKAELALGRFENAEDGNMLDGFMMALQVYPDLLDYHYGTEHLEILVRPIPRRLWPSKPVGGYVNKLGLNDNMGGGTVGISQTIYGSFYGEGGVGGIIVLSIMYGWLFASLMHYGERYNSDARWLVKGLVFASAIPLLRGGDLPGIYAFIGMAFWPVFILLYQYNKHLKKINQAARRQVG
ncbi:MAG: hypothetical protein WBA12_06465, partial [Catalinimonas sp.]